MVLLPDVVLARFQHGHALYNGKRGTLTPADLNGKRVGIRSFTTTTGAWLRGILANDYGVDLDSIDWVTFEDAHVAEYKDTTKRAPAGQADRADAARWRARCGARRESPSIPTCSRCLPTSQRRRRPGSPGTSVLPINHMVVVSRALSEKHPDVVREVHRMLAESGQGAVRPRRASRPTRCAARWN